MNKINIRLYGCLNDALPVNRRQITFPVFLVNRISLVEILNSLSVPIDEIDLILANGNDVDFQYIPQNNDRISIYPRFYNIDISPMNLCHRGLVH